MKRDFTMPVLIALLINLAAFGLCSAASGKIQPRGTQTSKKVTVSAPTTTSPKQKTTNSKYWVISALFKI